MPNPFTGARAFTASPLSGHRGMEIHHQGIIFSPAQSTCYYGAQSQQNSLALHYVLTSVLGWKWNLGSFLQVCPMLFGGFLAHMESEGRTSGLVTLGLKASAWLCWVIVVACVSVGLTRKSCRSQTGQAKFLAPWRQVSLGSEHWILARTLCDGPLPSIMDRVATAFV